MKKISFLILLVTISFNVLSQNTFNENGDIIINSGNLVQTGVHNLQTQSSVKLKNYLLFDGDGDFTGGNYYTIQDHSIGNYLRMGYNWSNHLIINSTGNIGIATTSPSSKLSIRNVGATNGVKLLDFSEADAESFIFKGDFLGVGGSGNALILGSNISGYESNMMSWRGDGNIGIGVSNPQTRLHISSSTAGDAVLKLEADTDNNNEDDNARLELYQDGGSLGAYIGFNKDWGGNWQPDNIFRIGTRYSGVDSFNQLVINTSNGNVGIGTDDPKSRLAVEGQIRATEVKVLADISVPDYVFELNYKLRSLQETKEFIAENKHLPEIPSATEIDENGIDLGNMNMKLLKKIEELTLYQIELLE